MQLDIKEKNDEKYRYSIMIDTFHTEKVPVEQIETWVKENFDFRPKQMIERLQLEKPIYEGLSYYGHFGKEGYSFEEIIKK